MNPVAATRNDVLRLIPAWSRFAEWWLLTRGEWPRLDLDRDALDHWHAYAIGQFATPEELR